MVGLTNREAMHKWWTWELVQEDESYKVKCVIMRWLCWRQCFGRRYPFYRVLYHTKNIFPLKKVHVLHALVTYKEIWLFCSGCGGVGVRFIVFYRAFLIEKGHVTCFETWPFCSVLHFQYKSGKYGKCVIFKVICVIFSWDLLLLLGITMCSKKHIRVMKPLGVYQKYKFNGLL